MDFSKLTIDSREYLLAWDFNGIADTEEEIGVNLFSAVLNMFSANARQLRGLLYAAIRLAEPRITLAQVGAMVRTDTITPIMDALSEAYVLAMPEESRGKYRPAPPPPPPPPPMEDKVAAPVTDEVAAQATECGSLKSE